MPFLYIDATAGGLLLQVVLGGAAGIAVVGRLALSRLPRFRKRTGGDEARVPASTASDPADEA